MECCNVSILRKDDLSWMVSPSDGKDVAVIVVPLSHFLTSLVHSLSSGKRQCESTVEIGIPFKVCSLMSFRTDLNSKCEIQGEMACTPVWNAAQVIWNAEKVSIDDGSMDAIG